MVCVPSSLPVASRTIVPCFGGVKVIAELQRTFNFSCAVAFLCLTLATIFISEKPNQLTSICEKHNSPIACQVW